MSDKKNPIDEFFAPAPWPGYPPPQQPTPNPYYPYPQGPTPQFPYPTPGGGWQPVRGGIDPKFLKKYKEAQDKEKARKEFEKKRKKTNLILDRVFWGFIFLCLLTAITRIY